MEIFFTENPDIKTIDTDPRKYAGKNDFTINSFRKLLEMNVITVGEGPLKGKFEGIDKNQINANMALLYFIENRISKMNGTPVPHPELIGLFSQLFNDTGLYSQEYMGGNKRGGGGGCRSCGN